MTEKTNRKLFISFLGASNYGECKYLIDGQASRSVRYVQEAMLEHYAHQGWYSQDCAYILLTDIAKQKNWENDGHLTREGTVIEQKGLRDCLGTLGLPMQVCPLENVPPGNDETEIMQLFSLLYELIKDGDELYFDITHGFRYLPIIALVLGNYSKFLKNVTVKWIGYGNYEGRDVESNVAQVVDLTSMSLLQDWTTAAADFINNGNAGSVSMLTQQQLRPILREARGADNNANAMKKMSISLEAIVNDFKYCRGFNIIESKNMKVLKNSLNDLEKCMIEPLTPIIEKINASISGFEGEENVKNGFAAARWCINNDMSQQAATILQETVITFISMRHGLNYKEVAQRSIASDALNIVANDIAKEKWDMAENDRELVMTLMANEPLLKKEDFLKTYKNLTELRNDLNHCGMRNNPQSASKIKEKIFNFHTTLFKFLSGE